MAEQENEKLRRAFVRRTVMSCAEVWVEFLRPVPFDQVFYMNGLRVRVSIDEYRTEQDTKPLRRESEVESLMSDRSADA